MTAKCPGSQGFSQPKPESIICPFCSREAEIWTDEVKTQCPGCNKTITRRSGQSCLDWCKYAKQCVGEEMYKKYLENKQCNVALTKDHKAVKSNEKEEGSMISEGMVKSLTYQINREIYSAYFYFGMSSYAESIGVKGFANWFKKQAKEELEHALKMYEYVAASGNRVIMDAIEQPPQDFTSALDLFERTLAHEKKVTGLIHKLVDQAKQENDKDTETFLQWYVKEQVEEEATPASIIRKIKESGTAEKALAEVDAQLEKRK